MTYNDSNIKENILNIINSYEPLAEWFQRNNTPIAYYEFYLDDGLDIIKYKEDEKEREVYKYYNDQLLVLKEMVDACLLWFNTKYGYTTKEKALKAAAAIAKIYELNKDKLGDASKKQLFINTTGITEEFAADALTPPDLVDLKIQLIEELKAKKMSRIDVIDQEKQKLQLEVEALDEEIIALQSKKTK